MRRIIFEIMRIIIYFLSYYSKSYINCVKWFKKVMYVYIIMPATKAPKAPKVVEPAPVDTPTKVKEPKVKAASKKTPATPATEKKPDTKKTVVESEPVMSEPVIRGDDVAKSECARLLSRVQVVMGELASLKKDLAALDKQIIRDLRVSAKKSGKRSTPKGDRQPSGFVKPAKITAELATFLGKPVDTMMARTEVTKEVNAYIREHKLQDPTNGRIIVPDAKLNGLLKVSKDDQLTYFNLQRYMKVHFIPSAPAPTA
jgi:chromatin remodeling complex protein RSC6